MDNLKDATASERERRREEQEAAVAAIHKKYKVSDESGGLKMSELDLKRVDGLIPVIVQNIRDWEVLELRRIREKDIGKTLALSIEVLVDCDRDSLIQIIDVDAMPTLGMFIDRYTDLIKDRTECAEMAKALKWEESDRGLIPTITQAEDLEALLMQPYKNEEAINKATERSKAVVMQAYSNKEAVNKTIEVWQGVYFHRPSEKHPEGEIWHKGLTSGDVQDIVGMRFPNDKYEHEIPSLILGVDTHSRPACHTKNMSCFYRPLVEG